MIETSATHELQFVIVMNQTAPDDDVEDVLAHLAEAGAHGRVSPGSDAIVIGAIGEHGLLDRLSFDGMPAVARVVSRV